MAKITIWITTTNLEFDQQLTSRCANSDGAVHQERVYDSIRISKYVRIFSQQKMEM
jgi:hypothetical protein